jgi:hypothetical protein
MLSPVRHSTIMTFIHSPHIIGECLNVLGWFELLINRPSLPLSYFLPHRNTKLFIINKKTSVRKAREMRQLNNVSQD